MIRTRLLFSLFLLSLNANSQIGTGQWRLHVPSNEAIAVVALSTKVYVAFAQGINEFNYASGELTEWNSVNSLSDVTISSMGYSSAQSALFIGYDNGNIDKIKNNKLTNIPAIKLADVQGSKRVNRIVEFEGNLFFATGFSIVKIDPDKEEVIDTYYPTNGNAGIVDIEFRNDSIYALTETKMYVANVNNFALADPSEWYVDERVTELTTPGEKYTELELLGDSLYLLFNNPSYGLDTVFSIGENSIFPAFIESFVMEINTIKSINNRLAVCYSPGVFLYDETFSSFIGVSNYSFSNSGPTLNALSYGNDSYWFADKSLGLTEYKTDTDNRQIIINGPPKKEVYKLDVLQGKLVVAGGGIASVFQTFSGSGVYIFEDEKWQLKDRENMTMWNGQNIWDFVSVAINPLDNNEIAVATYSEVPLSILKADGQVESTFTPLNSNIELTSLGNNSAQIASLNYDDEGNLWFLNGYTTEPLKVYTKEKEWYSFSVNSAAAGKFGDALVIDFNGNKWLAVRDAGLFGLNDNGTINNSSDDKIVVLNTGDFSGALPSNRVTAIAVDFDNEIWIGTDNGFAVLYNSDQAFDAGSGEYNAQRIKLEFEGNVEFVLGNTSITDIIVDGANRKWIATSNSGLVLLSEDGSEIIEQHTAENSPLISNNILNIKLNNETGELFIITDKGLVSYRTDATYEDPDYKNVVVFPNPARPDFDGPITIQGIRFNSDVKITDVAGNLVYKTTSNGGTATWNGKTLDGVKVPTGVYLIWTAANEGKGRKVGKVLIVN